MAWKKETAVIGGTVKMRKAGSGLPFTPVGLCSTVQQTHETNDLTLPDATNPMGGTYDKLEKVTRMGIQLNMREIFARNLAIQLYGTVYDVPSTTVTEEPHVVEVGGTCMLAKMPLTIDEIVDSATGAVTYVEDVDYKITGAGFEVLAGGDLATAIAAAAVSEETFSVDVSYTSADYDEIEAITNSGEEWELMFEGANAVGQKGKINAHYWRVRFGLAESMDFISVDDFMGQTVTAEVLADNSRGAGRSAYMKINKQKNVPVAP
jgi:hypothetical protein